MRESLKKIYEKMLSKLISQGKLIHEISFHHIKFIVKCNILIYYPWFIYTFTFSNC